jgi:hypothetical protein
MQEVLIPRAEMYPPGVLNRNATGWRWRPCTAVPLHSAAHAGSGGQHCAQVLVTALADAAEPPLAGSEEEDASALSCWALASRMLVRRMTSRELGRACGS